MGHSCVKFRHRIARVLCASAWFWGRGSISQQRSQCKKLGSSCQHIKEICSSSPRAHEKWLIFDHWKRKTITLVGLHPYPGRTWASAPPLGWIQVHFCGTISFLHWYIWPCSLDLWLDGISGNIDWKLYPQSRYLLDLWVPGTPESEGSTMKGLRTQMPKQIQSVCSIYEHIRGLKRVW